MHSYSVFVSFSSTFWRSPMFSELSIRVFFCSSLGEEVGFVNDLGVSSSFAVSPFFAIPNSGNRLKPARDGPHGLVIWEEGCPMH